MVSVDGTPYLQPALERLRLAILEQNRPGSVDGLLARHILLDNPHLGVDWQVAVGREWIETEFRASNIEHVAALGYLAWSNPVFDFRNELAAGLERVIERDAFKGEHLSLARRPSRLLGIILGAIALGTAGESALAWCRLVLAELERKDAVGFDPLVSYLFYRGLNKKISVNGLAAADTYALAFSDWVVRHGMQDTDPSYEQLQSSRNRLLFEAATSLKFESAPQAAFIWTGVNATLFQVLGEVSAQPKHVALVLGNFEAAMRRWRWDKPELQEPIRWQIAQEREVQDILWLILRSYFPDVVDEDALPRFGHSFYKADFGIPSLKLIVEAKFATKKEDFKKIEKEVQEDSIPYLRSLRYESIVVFIYDDSASVQEHELTRRALLEVPGIVNAVIVSRPSQLVPKSAGQT